MFVGGQMSLNGNGQVVGDDMTTQAAIAFVALARMLADAGLEAARRCCCRLYSGFFYAG